MGHKGRRIRVKHMFGANDEGLPDTPKKIGNVKLSRIVTWRRARLLALFSPWV